MTDGRLASRILVQAFELSRGRDSVPLRELAEISRVPAETVGEVLAESFGMPVGSNLSISSFERLKLALGAAKEIGLDAVARKLSWQEFEEFTEHCLVQAGYVAERNVRVKGKTRSWQIDVVGTKTNLIVCFDCKHWKPPNYRSKFSRAAVHQRIATMKLLKNRDANWGGAGAAGLPVILTIHEPPVRIINRVAVLSVQRLPDFLAHLDPFIEEMPFIQVVGGTGGKPYERNAYDRGELS